MRKLLAVLLAVLALYTSSVAFGAENVPDNMALLELGSAAEGSTLNYFVLRTVMGYCDTAGLCTDTMFEGVILLNAKSTDSPERVEAYLEELTGKNGVFSSAEQVANDLKENELMGEDKAFPLYAAFPNVSGFCNGEKERIDLCEYFIDTLVFAVEYRDYQSVYLAGIYFDESYDEDEGFRTECMALAEEKGLFTIAATAKGHAIEADFVYACNAEFSDRLGAVKDGGVVVSLGGVPNDSDDSHLRALLSDGIQLCEFDGDTPKLFTFEANNNLYDCAISIEQNVPNKNGRLAYDCIKSYIDGDFEALRNVYDGLLKTDDGTEDKNGGGEDKGLPNEVIAAIAVCVAGLICIAYILYRKAKRQ